MRAAIVEGPNRAKLGFYGMLALGVLSTLTMAMLT
jgi:hypothetical protein